MFANCENLTDINISSLNTEEVTNMAYMFSGCTNLTSINLSGLDISKVQNISYMFSGCANLVSLDLSSFFTKNDLEILSSLTSFKIISFLGFRDVTNMSYIFSGCNNLESISIDLSYLSYFPRNIIDITYIIHECYNLQKIKIKINEKIYPKVIKQIRDQNKEYIKKDFCLINSLIFGYNPNFNGGALIRINKELYNSFDQKGFQIFSLINDTLYGVLEGPISSPYQNGFFLFKMIYSQDHPWKPPKFYFISKIFHPNINEENGFVSVDILREMWNPSLTVGKIIYSVQSLLDEPNTDVFLNQSAAELYKKDKNEYDDVVRKYTSEFANYSLYQKEIAIKYKIEFIYN